MEKLVGWGVVKCKLLLCHKSLLNVTEISRKILLVIDVRRNPSRYLPKREAGNDSWPLIRRQHGVIMWFTRPYRAICSILNILNKVQCGDIQEGNKRFTAALLVYSAAAAVDLHEKNPSEGTDVIHLNTKHMWTWITPASSSPADEQKWGLFRLQNSVFSAPPPILHPSLSIIRTSGI